MFMYLHIIFSDRHEIMLSTRADLNAILAVWNMWIVVHSMWVSHVSRMWGPSGQDSANRLKTHKMAWYLIKIFFLSDNKITRCKVHFEAHKSWLRKMVGIFIYRQMVLIGTCISIAKLARNFIWMTFSEFNPHLNAIWNELELYMNKVG